jgi:hypothetical protein
MMINWNNLVSQFLGLHDRHVERIMSYNYTAEECERFAAECLETLKRTFDSKRRAELVETAKQWLRLAEKAAGRRRYG